MGGREEVGEGYGDGDVGRYGRFGDRGDRVCNMLVHSIRCERARERESGKERESESE